MTNFLLIRHAMTDSVDKIIAGRGGSGLNQEGRNDAEALAFAMSRTPVDAIYSSPLARSRSTAEILARNWGLIPDSAEELTEIDYGDWTGHAIDTLSEQPLWQQYNAFRSGTQAPGGEMMIAVQMRAVCFLRQLSQRHRQQSVAVVSHGDVIRLILAFFAGIPIDLFYRITVMPASVSRVTMDEQHCCIHTMNWTTRTP